MIWIFGLSWSMIITLTRTTFRPLTCLPNTPARQWTRPQQWPTCHTANQPPAHGSCTNSCPSLHTGHSGCGIASFANNSNARRSADPAGSTRGHWPHTPPGQRCVMHFEQLRINGNQLHSVNLSTQYFTRILRAFYGHITYYLFWEKKKFLAVWSSISAHFNSFIENAQFLTCTNELNWNKLKLKWIDMELHTVQFFSSKLHMYAYVFLRVVFFLIWKFYVYKKKCCISNVI